MSVGFAKMHSLLGGWRRKSSPVRFRVLLKKATVLLKKATATATTISGVTTYNFKSDYQCPVSSSSYSNPVSGKLKRALAYTWSVRLFLNPVRALTGVSHFATDRV